MALLGTSRRMRSAERGMRNGGESQGKGRRGAWCVVREEGRWRGVRRRETSNNQHPTSNIQDQLLLGSGQHGFEVGGLVFAGDYADFDALEAGLLEPAVEIAFREAGPTVAIELSRPVKAVPGEIEDHD